MNITYETTKERGAPILMPSSMVDSLNPSTGGLVLALAANNLAEPSVPTSALAHAVRRAPVLA
jgi:hypothetical protein